MSLGRGSLCTRKDEVQVVKLTRLFHKKSGIVGWGVLQDKSSLESLVSFSSVIEVSIKKNFVICVFGPTNPFFFPY